MLSLSVRNVLRRTLGSRTTSTKTKSRDDTIDSQQVAFLNENCFLIDADDKVTGKASKWYCHRVQPDGTLPLHRAFSVFLFNKKGEFLLHRRSSDKITYPNLYTNTCCSHPLSNVPGEDEDRNVLGIKRAAQRRLQQELGVPQEQIPLENFRYITRFQYKDGGDGKWGEHEISYILFLQDDVTLNPNPNEVSELRYVSRKELDDYLPTLKGQFTPWFSLILDEWLKLWWDNLNNLDQFMDHKNIRRF